MKCLHEFVVENCYVTLLFGQYYYESIETSVNVTYAFILGRVFMALSHQSIKFDFSSFPSLLQTAN